MKTINILATLLLSIILISTLSSIAIAGTPPVPPAKPTPAPSGGGGGGGGGGGSSAPAFQPHTEQLKSSDGSTIGSLDIKDYFTVVVTAGNNTTVDNQTYALALRSELGGKPEGAVMDITIGFPASLPAGMNDTIILASANVSRSARYGWSLKDGSTTVSFTIPASAMANQSNTSQLYIVRYDGTGYQITPASLTTNADGTVTLTAPATSDFGLFAAVLASPAKPEPVPTPTPTPEPTVVPTATPEPTPVSGAPALPGGVAGMAAVFVGGASIGAVAVFFIGRILN